FSRKSSGSLRPSSASHTSTQDFSDRPINRRSTSPGDQSSPCARTAREKLVLAIGSLSTSTPSQSKIASTRSVRLVARHGDAIAAARVRPVVPHGAVLNTAIVPEGDRVRAPAEAALEQRTLHVLVEIVQDGVAFVARHASKRTGEAAIDIQCLLACH